MITYIKKVTDFRETMVSSFKQYITNFSRTNLAKIVLQLAFIWDQESE